MTNKIIILMSCLVCLSLMAISIPARSEKKEAVSDQISNQTLRKISEQPSLREAYIDEETGELISTPPADTSLSGKNNQSLQTKEQEIKYITHPDGMIEGRLNGQFQSQLIVTMDCDGKLTQSHADDHSPSTENHQPDDCEHGH